MNKSCLLCKNYYPRSEDWRGKECHAFPRGIPWDIMDGFVRHDSPTEDQENDLIFTLLESLEDIVEEKE